MEQLDALLKEAPSFAQIGRGFGLENKLNFLRDVGDTVALQRQRHSFLRTHRIDRDGELGGLPVDQRLFEEQRFAATGRFHFAIGPFRNHEIGLDRRRNALQLACLFERLQKLAE